MPADPSGVTTDDQGSPGNGADDRSPAETQRGRSVSSSTGEAGRSGTDAATGDKAARKGDGARKRGDGDTSASGGAEAAEGAGDGDREPTSSTEVTASGGGEAPASPDAGPEPATASAPAQTTELPTTDLSGGQGAPGEPPATDLDASPVPDTVVDPQPGGEPGATPPPDVPGGPAGPGAEPPPAPVLTPGAAPAPPGSRRREGRGRHATPRRDRAAMRGLRVNQRLWSVDPWSVFKLSILFYLCVALVVLVAGTLLYNAGRRIGTIDQFESFITRMGAYGECVVKTDVPEGTDFEEDEDECGEGEVLVGGFELDDGTLFRTVAVGGAVLVLAGSIGNVLMTVLVNLLNEVTGGLRHAVVKEPVARPRGERQAGPPRQPRQRRQPGAGPPVASGSPPQQPQG